MELNKQKLNVSLSQKPYIPSQVTESNGSQRIQGRKIQDQVPLHTNNKQINSILSDSIPQFQNDHINSPILQSNNSLTIKKVNKPKSTICTKQKENNKNYLNQQIKHKTNNSKNKSIKRGKTIEDEAKKNKKTRSKSNHTNNKSIIEKDKQILKQLVKSIKEQKNQKVNLNIKDQIKKQKQKENERIRIANATKFKPTSQSDVHLPWGLNQQRLKNYIISKMDQNKKSDICLRNQEIRKKIKEKSQSKYQDKSKEHKLIKKEKRKHQSIKQNNQTMNSAQDINMLKQRYQKIAERYNSIHQQYSLLGMISQSSGSSNLGSSNHFNSAEENNHFDQIHEFDSFFSDQYNHTHYSIQNYQDIIEQDQEMISNVKPIQNNQQETDSLYSLAALVIQKHWRAYSVRKQFIQSMIESNQQQQYQFEQLDQLHLESLMPTNKFMSSHSDNNILDFNNSSLMESEKASQKEIRLHPSSNVNQEDYSQNLIQLDQEANSNGSPQLLMKRESNPMKMKVTDGKAQGCNMIFDQEAFINVEWEEDEFQRSNLDSNKKKENEHILQNNFNNLFNSVQSDGKTEISIFLEEQKQKWMDALSQIEQLEKTNINNTTIQDLKKHAEENLIQIQAKDVKPNTQKHKKNLSIDIEQIENDNTLSINQKNMDKKQLEALRMALGDEHCLRIQSSLNSNPASNVENSSEKKFIFDQNPFKEFQNKKFKELLQTENIAELLEIRENLLMERENKQTQIINEQLEKQLISPRTHNKKQIELEKWVTKEKENLKASKKIFDQIWEFAQDTIKKTQRDLMFVQQFQDQKSENIQILKNSFSEGDRFPVSIKTLKTQISNSIHSVQSPSNYSQKRCNVLHTSPSPSPKYNLVLQNKNRFNQSQNQGNNKNEDIENIVEQVFNSIINQELLEIQNIKDFAQKPRGVKTSLTSVKLYLNKLSQFIKEQYEEQILKNLMVPLGPTPIEILKYMHYQEMTESSNFESSTESQYTHSAIMSVSLYQQFEAYLENQKQLSSQKDWLIEIEHIHNKVIFDALNEALDEQRPYGLNGVSFPWIIDAKNIKNKSIKQLNLDQILDLSEKRVIEWAQILAGILIDKEDNQYPQILLRDEEYLSQVKEERLCKLLNTCAIENEEKWINYDEESTEVKVELSEMVLDYLMNEMVSEL